MADAELDATGTKTDADANGDSETSTSDVDAGPCGSCGGGSVCVEHEVLGGALIPPDDAGQCPAGRVILPNAIGCSLPPTFDCAPLPGACFPPGAIAPSHCVCAPSLCSSGEQCTNVSPTLMRCALLAP